LAVQVAVDATLLEVVSATQLRHILGFAVHVDDKPDEFTACL